MKLSKTNQGIIKAYDDGYRVIGGVVFNPTGRILRGWIDKDGYNGFKPYKVYPYLPVHKFVAYQKFGNKIFEDGVQVRHLDNNSQNNNESNLNIGTQSDNMMDKLPKKRMNQSIIAANNVRKFTDGEMEQILEDYRSTGSYKYIMEKWNISSKGTLHYMLNNRYVTTK